MALLHFLLAPVQVGPLDGNAVIDMLLFYNEGTYPSNLAEVGVWPSDVYKVDYELIIRDEYSYEILYYNTWTFTR